MTWRRQALTSQVGFHDSLPARNPWPPICSLWSFSGFFLWHYRSSTPRGPSHLLPSLPLCPSRALSLSLFCPTYFMGWLWLSLRVAQNPSPKLCRPVHLSSTSNGHPAAVSTSLRPRYSRCNRWLLQEEEKVHIGRREQQES
ncbi:hypothetical protein M440DRAFT_214312 [Trichoderma longibrachiatum ATCC 18648]|uniref:Uncharacterized protein n=1 Tax=Trichoderma longibrachiatum ATCC 18648 TaxID=983965 RepID=A0A2T4BQ89_TRILO|nr:hypothetical protein M440DRAFT_214312 [Trichoderma longibrachiatum ATCC 18648]